MSDHTFETGDRHVVARSWLVALLAAPNVAAAAERPAVPMSLGQGTGGDGAWTCISAEHSPTTIRVDEAAGREGTPAAILEFKYVGDKYNWNWRRIWRDSRPTFARRSGCCDWPRPPRRCARRVSLTRMLP